MVSATAPRRPARPGVGPPPARQFRRDPAGAAHAPRLAGDGRQASGWSLAHHRNCDACCSLSKPPPSCCTSRSLLQTAIRPACQPRGARRQVKPEDAPRDSALAAVRAGVREDRQEALRVDDAQHPGEQSLLPAGHAELRARSEQVTQPLLQRPLDRSVEQMGHRLPHPLRPDRGSHPVPRGVEHRHVARRRADGGVGEGAEVLRRRRREPVKAEHRLVLRPVGRHLGVLLRAVLQELLLEPCHPRHPLAVDLSDLRERCCVVLSADGPMGCLRDGDPDQPGVLTVLAHHPAASIRTLVALVHIGRRTCGAADESAHA